MKAVLSRHENKSKTNGYASCWLQAVADPTAIYCTTENPAISNRRSSVSPAGASVSLDVAPLSYSLSTPYDFASFLPPYNTCSNYLKDSEKVHMQFLPLARLHKARKFTKR
jgi:hypothetical protein